MRTNKLSEASCSAGCVPGGRVLKIDMDGMDQAKFKAPRNISNAKNMQDLWRPSIHVVGILIWGLIEAYVLMEPDIPKDSSMQITMLCLALNFARQRLTAKGMDMPLHLVVQADNTCRETKNKSVSHICRVACDVGGLQVGVSAVPPCGAHSWSHRPTLQCSRHCD